MESKFWLHKMADRVSSRRKRKTMQISKKQSLGRDALQDWKTDKQADNKNIKNEQKINKPCVEQGLVKRENKNRPNRKM